MTKTAKTAQALLVRMQACSTYLESRRPHQKTDLAQLMLFDKIQRSHSFVDRLQGITNLCFELQLIQELLLVPVFEEMDKFATSVEMHKE